jgi:hypothetical protein
MTALKSLAFASMPKTSGDPTVAKRERLVERLQEQLALFKNPQHIRQVQRRVVVDGEKRLVTQDQRIWPWWSTDAAGQTFMSVKHGGKPVEFEKGKAAIAVPSKDKLPAVIETLVAAVRAGELDEIIRQASKQRPFQKKKVA